MLFEDIRWDWNADQVRITRPLLLGGERYVALKAPGRDQSFLTTWPSASYRGQWLSLRHRRFRRHREHPEAALQYHPGHDNISALRRLFKGGAARWPSSTSPTSTSSTRSTLSKQIAAALQPVGSAV